MKNYQRLYYQHYYLMVSDGIETATTRCECFAPPEVPTSYCPFIQRWWYDYEAGYAVRLPRNPLGEVIGKYNAALLKRQERSAAKDAKYIGIRLDQPVGRSDDGSEFYFELEDENADVDEYLIDKARHEAVEAYIYKLSKDDRKLWELMKSREKKRKIAEQLNITTDGVRYREKRLRSIISSNIVVKSFI